MNKHGKRLITLAALATTTTAIIHIANKVVAASAGLKEMLDTNGKNYYHWRFGDIYYTRKGKGSPILLIHDMLPGGSGYEWSRIEDDLALEHTVYNIDLPGCGRSEKPGMTYTNYVYVQSICDFIKNVIGEKTDVIVSGYSGSFAQSTVSTPNPTRRPVIRLSYHVFSFSICVVVAMPSIALEFASA